MPPKRRPPPVKRAAGKTAASRAKEKLMRPPKRKRDEGPANPLDSADEADALSFDEMWRMSRRAAGPVAARPVTPTRPTRPAESGHDAADDAGRSPAHLTSSGRPSAFLSSLSQSQRLRRRSGSPPRALFAGGVRETISCDSLSGDAAAGAPGRRDASETIALSPKERPSTQIIRKAVATRPAVAPATMWICLDDDDDDEGEIRVVSCPRSPSPPKVLKKSGAERVSSPTSAPAAAVPLSGVSSDATQRLPDTGGNWRGGEPIAEVLPPTFRPRKGTLLANKPPLREISPMHYAGIIYDDDDDDDDISAGDVDTTHVTTNNRALPTGLSSLGDVNNSTGTIPYMPSSYASMYIKDDDYSSDDPDATQILRRSISGLPEETVQGCEGEKWKKGDDVSNDNEASEQKILLKQETEEERPQVLFAEDDIVHHRNASLISSTRSVRDFLFPSRRNSTTDVGDSSFFTAHNDSNLKAAGMDATANIDDEGGAGAKAARPVEKLRQLYPSRFTRKGFLSTAESVVSKLHCLGPGEFWEAFVSAEFVGEGSFGLVWKCRTVDGDLVAVKSCPISFHSRGSIDDAYSVLREIAVMRFLSEHEVPYVLPLHSAFFVQAREALPPEVVAAVEWKAHLARAEEARNQQMRIERYLQKQNHRGRNRGQPKENVAQEGGEKEMMSPPEETEEEKKERALHERVRLPQFLSISLEEATECDATAFLVTELCDGDLESIERHDTITKGVAFCVSSALAAMHRLGLVHLDLKPSNVLFAYENSPSQQCQRVCAQTQQLQQPHACSRIPTAGLGSPQPSSVKFYLSDFGNCRIVNPGAMDRVSGVVGTFEYMDLQALRDKSCSRATDCFSLGATLYELIFSRRLYPRCTNPKCRTEESHSRLCFVEAAKQPVALQPMGGPLSILQKVTAGLLLHDPQERWTAERCRSFFLIHAASNPVLAPSVAATNDTAAAKSLC